MDVLIAMTGQEALAEVSSVVADAAAAAAAAAKHMADVYHCYEFLSQASNWEYCTGEKE